MSFITDLVLPKDYGYVLIAAAGTFIVAIWHGSRVTGYRKKAGVKYPKHYGDSGDIAAAGSEKKKEAINLFNCAQRAHGNFQENYPIALSALLLAGLQFPRTAAVMGAGWTVSRVAFAIGYTNPAKPDGSGRYVGISFWLFQLGLIGLTAYTGVKMVL